MAVDRQDQKARRAARSEVHVLSLRCTILTSPRSREARAALYDSRGL